MYFIIQYLVFLPHDFGFYFCLCTLGCPNTMLWIVEMPPQPTLRDYDRMVNSVKHLMEKELQCQLKEMTVFSTRGRWRLIA